ncbi:MAG: KEOPS complex subunit Cgi121 [Crenarchaeota archaeon]|nr:KEOPS complex subunit Cgi121 [Thermoproteota archaeon]MCR8454484.1 KEOPS complex subunit Cgi121 [Thermoproteota archaeon]MCR8455099.1 KEOPS complex subunit Cgi121 [Thermoproteota archaeon]MCR8462813.1 KEOPS complex subunit Cgi121 [Thermoproteota archaeon]MCR8472512.1 KEOPS complex subunit Cgi121 [Thermoproteota archaeon]
MSRVHEETDKVIKIVAVKNRQKLLEVIENFSGTDTLIQVIPCDLVVNGVILKFILDLTLELLNSGKNIAKKSHIEFLLRLFARTQIRDVIDIIKGISANVCWLVMYSKSTDVCELYNKLVSEGVIEEVASSSCQANINKILSIYDLDEAQLAFQAESRSEPLESVLLKAILEKISMSIVSR